MPPKPVEPKQYESWDDVDRALARLGKIEPEREEESGKLKQLIQATKDEFEPRISRLDGEIAAITEGLRVFVVAHKVDLGEARSMSLKHGSIGLRFSPPKLVTLGKTTWVKVLELIGDLPTALRKRFLRISEEVDKKAIKEAIEQGAVPDDLRRQIKVDLIQEEQVTYELASESAVRG